MRAITTAEFGPMAECPFCAITSDFTVEDEEYSGLYIVRCSYCNAQGPEGETESSAIQLWNFRAGSFKGAPKGIGWLYVVFLLMSIGIFGLALACYRWFMKH